MELKNRHERLETDRAALTALAAESTIFSFEPAGDPPDRYTLTFRGKGLARDTSANSDVVAIDLHQIDLRLPYSYPTSPPDLRWLSPLWHPNISFSGLVNLSDVGIAWTSDISLEFVCERLWDIARGAFVDPGRATNFAAKNWYGRECPFDLPVDPRPLRDRAAASGANIVRYQRRSGQTVQLADARPASDVMFIDENTPTPPLPPRGPYVPFNRRRDGDDVLYIGPE